MSTIKVDTIATRTGSGNITLSNNVASLTSAGAISGTNLTASGTLGVTGITTLSNRMNINFNGSATQAMHLKDTGGGNLASFGLYYNPSNTLIGNIQNANNTGIHLNVGTNGSIVFDQTGYTAANALDDYEEGTWIPFYTTANNNLTLNGNASTTASMYTTQSGSYVKIGKKVICHMSMSTTGVTSHAGSGNLWVGGLPFTTVTTATGEPRGVNGAMAGRFNSFTPNQLVCNGNTTTLQIRAGFETYPTRSNLDTGGSTNRNVIEALIVYSTTA